MLEQLGLFLFGMIGSAGLAVPAFIMLSKKKNTLVEERQKLGTQIIQLQEVLAGIPDGLYRWNIHNGVENCSARMAVLLDLPKGTQSRFGDILTCFEKNAAARLNQSVADLHREGLSFDIILPLHGGDDRIIQAVGQRVLNDDGAPLVDLLWMRLANEAVIENGPLAQQLKAVTHERNRLYAILDTLPLPVWLRDSGGHMIYRNAASPEQDYSIALAQRAMEAGREVRERFRFPYGGDHKTFEVSEIPLPAGEGLVGLGEDISSAELMIDHARRGEKMLHGALNHLVTAIAIFGGDTRLSFYNRAYASLWGLAPDWLDTRPSYGEVLDRLRERRRLPEHANFKAYRQAQLAQFVELETPVRTSLHLPDNSTVRSIISPHPVSGLIMTFEDVTDTLALESSHKALAAVQRETLDNLFEGIIVFGPDGKVRLFNPAYADIWAFSNDFLDQSPHVSAILEATKSFYDGAENWQTMREQMAARFMKREPSTHRMIRSDGTILEYACVPLPDGGSLVSYLDVTDSAVVEQAIQERSLAQQDADTLKADFISNVSYEIRTPLTTLLGFSELLCENYYGELNKRQMSYAQGIHSCAEQLEHTVNDILDLASIEAGQVSLNYSSVTVQPLLLGLFALVKETAKHHQITLELDCPDDIGPLDADEKRLKQVLFNLIINAIHYSDTGSTVVVSATHTPDHLSLSVADAGQGIAPQDQTRIFDSFQRLNRHENAHSGAGLGLTLVKHLIDLHGGHVTLDSLEGKGTVVTCHLPTQKVKAPHD